MCYGFMFLIIIITISLDEIRNEICETNHYEYMDYFNEHRGKEKYYVLKVKIDNILSYVAYDERFKISRYLSRRCCDEKIVQDAILKKYKDDVTKEDVESLDVGYENNKFVYYVKVQREDYLLYLYYDIVNGEFVKTYHISANES